MSLVKGPEFDMIDGKHWNVSNFFRIWTHPSRYNTSTLKEFPSNPLSLGTTYFDGASLEKLHFALSIAGGNEQ